MQSNVELTRHPLVGEQAPDANVIKAPEGVAVPLASLWRDQPLVLVFLRHFGCAFCREHIEHLRHDVSLFDQRGARIAFLTVATPADTIRFCQDRKLESTFLCLSDHEKAVYNAYGLARGGAQELFTPHVIARGFQATLHGHFTGLPKGDPLQMPGVFIVDTSGIVRYAHRHKDAADNPPNADLLAVLNDMPLH